MEITPTEANKAVADSMASVLDYKEPTTLPPGPVNLLEETWGQLPNSRWSNVGRMIQVKVFDDATAATTGDGKVIFLIPPELDGTRLVRAVAFVSTVSSSGNPTFQIRNITQSKDCLVAATPLVIDVSEFTSLTATTATAINNAIIFRSGDLIAIDCDTAGTGAKGAGIHLSLQ